MKEIETEDYEISLVGGIREIIKDVGYFYFGEYWVEFWGPGKKTLIAVFRSNIVESCVKK